MIRDSMTSSTALAGPASIARLLLSPRLRPARFVLTGGLAGCVPLGLLRLLEGAGVDALLANGFAFLLAAPMNFLLSQVFTWADRPAESAGSDTLGRRWARYHASIAGTALLNMMIFAVARTAMSDLIASALGIVAAGVGNFLLGDRLVFRPGTAETAIEPQGSPAPRWRMLSSLSLEEAISAAGFIGVITLSLGLFGWSLSRNGYANQYYAAAVLSMSESWKAFFFGSIDSVGFITVDKPPFALWVQAFSVRLFGFSSWSILLPQALAGTASAFMIYLMARRRFGALAGTLAALIFIVTPITVAVHRDNLPDPILILLMVAGAWATLDAVQTGRLRSLLLSAALVGIGFNTKMLQAYLVVPAFVLTYALAAPGSIWLRVRNLVAAGVVLGVVSASWMLVVDAIPAELRPYIGGSQTNSVLDLVLGYNGLGRILGRDGVIGTAGDAYGAGGANFGGASGLSRLFNQQVGGQISWLLPLAAVALLAGLLIRGRGPRTDGQRAWYVLWGGWLMTHAVVFSMAEGTFHPYYTSAMAPAIAALSGPGVLALWELYRRSWKTAWVLPVALGATSAWAYVLLGRTDWLPWLRLAVASGTVTAVVLLVIGRFLRSTAGRNIAAVALMVGMVSVMSGPTAWSLTPVISGFNAVNPTAGPVGSNDFGPQSGGQRFNNQNLPEDGALSQVSGAPDPDVSKPPAVRVSTIESGRVRGPDGNAQPPEGGQAFGFGGPGGGQVSPQLISYLQAERGSTAYLVAVTGANSAAPIILATGGEPVMAMGGFTNSDPAPTIPQLEDLALSGELRFVLLGNGGGPGRGNNQVDAWVKANGTLVDATVYGGTNGQQLYDLSSTTAQLALAENI